MTGAGLPHSEIFGSGACMPLTEAYRSLLRPSSPDDAKASIICCNWFMQTHSILGVYFTHLHSVYCLSELSKNEIELQQLAPAASI